MKEITVGLAILILIVLVSGCTSNNSKSNTSGSQNNSDIIVQIDSDSSWSGTLTYNNKTQAIKENGIYNLGRDPGAVTVILQKTGNAGTLKVQLIKDGNVIVNQSTSGGQGVISINYSS